MTDTEREAGELVRLILDAVARQHGYQDYLHACGEDPKHWTGIDRTALRDAAIRFSRRVLYRGVVVQPVGETPEVSAFLDRAADQVHPATHTIREWEYILGITIADPVGFDRTDPQMWERNYTREEFLERAARSTCRHWATHGTWNGEPCKFED